MILRKLDRILTALAESFSALFPIFTQVFILLFFFVWKKETHYSRISEIVVYDFQLA